MSLIAQRVSTYLSLVKFSHTVFALPFAGVGLTLGLVHYPDAPIGMLLLQVLLCMVFARNTAMAFNRLVDAPIDANNPRTAIREIPAGKLSRRQVTWFVAGNVLAFVATTWTINWLCFLLSPVALAVIMGYSYTKRFTPLCHLILGLGLALAPIGAYMAVTGTIVPEVLILGVGVLTWVSGFDIIYALQDESFDRSQQLFSIPVWLGGVRALRTAQVLHLITAFAILAFAVRITEDSGLALVLVGLASVVFISMLIWQHRLVRPEDLSRVNLAFFTANGVASVLFGVLTILGLILS